MSTDHIETPEEIEASLRKREEMFLQWAKSREAANMVTKSTPSTQRTYDMSAEWRAYIDARDKSWVEAVTAATGEVLAEERKRVAEEHAKMRVEFERELLQIRNEFLQAELDRERGVKRPLRVVQPVQTEQMIG